jgi:arsenic resistance protein ArsH
MMSATMNGDLNNTSAERIRSEIVIDPAYNGLSLAIPASEDDPEIRKNYRPFLLNDADASQDWVAPLELSTALRMVDMQVLKKGDERLRVLVLHGSMRQRYCTVTRMDAISSN